MKRQTLNLFTPSGSSRRFSKEVAHLAVLLRPWWLLLELPSPSWISTKHSSDKVTTQRVCLLRTAHMRVLLSICTARSPPLSPYQRVLGTVTEDSTEVGGGHYSLCGSGKKKGEDKKIMRLRARDLPFVMSCEVPVCPLALASVCNPPPTDP